MTDTPVGTYRGMDDGTVRDVCSGTGSGPTKKYYLNRPVMEVEMLRRQVT